MRLRVLGCSGGIGAGLRTTALLVDDDVLVDAGTGAGDIEVDALARIDHVFVTHAHLDHVCAIPFLADTAGPLRDRPVVVHAPGATIAALRAHLFNNVLWPDFTRLPHPAAPYLAFEEIQCGQTVSLDGRRITAIPAVHAVPAVGYWLDSGAASLVFTGDTGPDPALWEVVNATANLRHVVIETAFSDRDHALARLAGHLCPHLLAAELRLLSRPAWIHITHLKPADRETTIREIMSAVPEYRPHVLERGDDLEF